MPEIVTDTYGLTDVNWKVLISRIQKGACTPILGAGASFPTLPLASQLAKQLALDFEYPYLVKHTNQTNGVQEVDNQQVDDLDLAQVAQYIALKYDDSSFPKEELQTRFEKVTPPDFSKPDEPHGILADFNLPIYITTNYDDFMFKALQSRGKSPRQAVCQWNNQIDDQWAIFKQDTTYIPSAKEPLVFHLHGLIQDPASMVLTEDDYLDFLVAISQDQTLLPTPIKGALSRNSLLVIGYGLRDWSFRILLRGLMATVNSSQTKLSVTVQIPPQTPTPDLMDYLRKYYDKFYDLKVDWSTASKFAEKLGTKWKDSLQDVAASPKQTN